MSNWQEVRSNSSGYSVNLRANAGDGQIRQTLIVGTAVTGLVRVEWIQARYGQIIPTNWSWVQAWQFMAPGQFMPLGYQVDDAQNLICGMAMAGDFEWLLLYEHDMLPAPDVLVRFNEYMKRGDVPVVSALYFTRSIPSEPLIYKGRGTRAFEDFDIGDLVWADGVPTGMLLVHMDLIRAMWEESEPYMIGSTQVRRVFETPARAWFDPETDEFNTQTGTSDLNWCQRVINDGFLAKAGFPEFQDKQYPFLVDTNILCEHIQTDLSGTKYPPGGARAYWTKIRADLKEWRERLHGAEDISDDDNPPTLGINVKENIKAKTRMGE